MNDITPAIENLKSLRPIFHSEDDLKFSFSLCLQKEFRDYSLRLEKPENLVFETRNNKQRSVRAPIDIVLIKDNIHYPIELKYKTKLLNTTYKGEDYNLTNHGAADIGRFGFRKDISRIEKYLNKNSNYTNGFVLIITNENDYFRNIEGENKLDSAFTFHDNYVLKKDDKSWNYDAIDKTKYVFNSEKNLWKYKKSEKSHWTCEGEKYFKLPLINEYKIDWQNYSKIENQEFKYCLISVRK